MNRIDVMSLPSSKGNRMRKQKELEREIRFSMFVSRSRQIHVTLDVEMRGNQYEAHSLREP